MGKSMRLSVRERNEMIRQGTKAALIGAGAFTCPYIDDDIRFAAWIEGYELGELRLAAVSKPDNNAKGPQGFWAEVRPIKGRKLMETKSNKG